MHRKMYRNNNPFDSFILFYLYLSANAKFSCNYEPIVSDNISRSSVWSIPQWPRFGVWGPPRMSEHRRLLPDIVRRAESTQGPEVLMGQMRSLHCEGQSFTSWEQSNTGIKSHIFRVMWPLTADTPPCARASEFTFNRNIFIDKI